MYRFASQLTANLEEIEQNLIDALKNGGFAILSEIDVRATLIESFDGGDEIESKQTGNDAWRQ